MENGFSEALRLFHRTARDVPAYKEFLKKHGVKPAAITTLDAFRRVPVMDKKKYLQQYSAKKLFPREEIPPMIYASSGSSGTPTFWFRGDEQEILGAKVHESIFKNIFGIAKRDETLVVVCFSMGVWVAGNYTLASCRELSRKGYRISTITPGAEMEDIMNVLQTIAPSFKNVILAGYPPFLMDVVNDAIRRKIALPKNIKFITAGDKFTEEWRSSLLKLAGARDPLRTAISIYGSADAGILGYETPLSIFLRRAAMRDSTFRENLFGDEPVLPALVQYDPKNIFFEENNGELLFTMNTASPLIRYNIHDIGKLYSYDEVSALATRCGIAPGNFRAELGRWNMPFLVKQGRNDVAVTFYALNIYPENIKAGLDDARIAPLVSGQFFAFNRSVHNEKKQELWINIELKENARGSKATERLIEKCVVENLARLNIEYRKLRSILGEAALPHIAIFPFGTGGFYKSNERGLIGIKGKKMRIIEARA